MKTLELVIPESLAARVDRAVEEGNFRNAGELTQTALRDFLARGRLALLERHQLEDIQAATHAAKRKK